MSVTSERLFGAMRLDRLEDRRGRLFRRHAAGARAEPRDRDRFDLELLGERERGADAASFTVSGELAPPGSPATATWMTQMFGSVPAVVAIAAPTAIGAFATASFSISSPPAALIAAGDALAS